MKKMKKVLALILAMAMVLGMGLTTMATNTTYDDAIRVYGVEAGEGETVTVTAYQIIQYDTSGKYVPVKAGTITEIGGKLTPTADNVLALSTSTTGLPSVELVSAGSGTDTYYTSTAESPLAVGTWMILVTGSSDYIYNPAIVSISQTADGIEYGELNLDTDSWGTDVWMKKSEPTIEKTVLSSDAESVEYGDILQFQLKATIPSYATNKTGLVFTISDDLDGLEVVVNEDCPVVATLDGISDDTLGSLVATAFTTGKTNVSVVFSGDDYIRSHGGEEVVITYYAQVTENAKVTVSEITNDVTLTYSTAMGTDTKTDQTTHYTFGIDTIFSGTVGTTNKTGEFIKIDESGNVSYSETGSVEVTNETELGGAVFELRIGSSAADAPKFADAEGNTQFTTTDDGRLEIVGLDADVTYYLVEVQAPMGYSINTTPIKVKITMNHDTTTGEFNGYTVEFDDGNTKAFTNYNYSVTEGTTTIAPEAGNPFGFKNTTLSTLPSTGGIGTTIFTVGGCIIMIAAAALFFMNRRKSEE